MRLAEEWVDASVAHGRKPHHKLYFDSSTVPDHLMHNLYSIIQQSIKYVFYWTFSQIHSCENRRDAFYVIYMHRDRLKNQGDCGSILPSLSHPSPTFSTSHRGIMVKKVSEDSRMWSCKVISLVLPHLLSISFLAGRPWAEIYWLNNWGKNLLQRRLNQGPSSTRGCSVHRVPKGNMLSLYCRVP